MIYYLILIMSIVILCSFIFIEKGCVVIYQKHVLFTTMLYLLFLLTCSLSLYKLIT